MASQRANFWTAFGGVWDTNLAAFFFAAPPFLDLAFVAAWTIDVVEKEWRQ